MLRLMIESNPKAEFGIPSKFAFHRSSGQGPHVLGFCPPQ